MLRALAEHPVLSALTVLAAGLQAGRQLIGSAGLSPFVHDTAASILLTTCGILWIRKLIPPVEPTLLIDTGGRQLVGVRSKRRWLPVLGCLVGLVLLVGWSARRPAVHATRAIFAGPWKVCGEFHASCGRAACVVLMDAENRPSVRDCVEPSDDSGFLNLDAPSFAAYEPRFVAAKCAGTTGPAVPLPDAALDKSCSGRVQLR